MRINTACSHLCVECKIIELIEAENTMVVSGDWKWKEIRN
jgi:hypothetical protein